VKGERTLVEVTTAGFSFVIAVCVAQAPESCAYFLADVDAGALDGSSVFRIVNLHNQPQALPAKIEVIQMGWRENDPGIPASLRHETTGVTGLRHTRGTVSLARFAPGAVYHSWFVCMRDEPELDEGGARHPDGQGFAAFGCVAQGFEHLVRLFDDHVLGPEYPERPTIVLSARRKVIAT
jgi:peptidyl-prolyl cis-trans isomerase A (cyclophilin A)